MRSKEEIEQKRAQLTALAEKYERAAHEWDGTEAGRPQSDRYAELARDYGDFADLLGWVLSEGD